MNQMAGIMFSLTSQCFVMTQKVKIIYNFEISRREVLQAANENNQHDTRVGSAVKHCVISRTGWKGTVVCDHLLILHDIVIYVYFAV